MPRLRRKATGTVVNVDDVTAARLIAGEYPMGEWEPFEASAPSADPAPDSAIAEEAPAVSPPDLASPDTVPAPAAPEPIAEAEAQPVESDADTAGAIPTEIVDNVLEPTSETPAPRRRTRSKK